MVFAPVACGGTFRGRLSPHNFAAPCSKLKPPELLDEREEAASRFLPRSRAMVYQALRLSSAFRVCVYSTLPARHPDPAVREKDLLYFGAGAGNSEE
jgi:hypothetical protein